MPNNQQPPTTNFPEMVKMPPPPSSSTATKHPSSSGASIPSSVFTTTHSRAPVDHSKSAYAHLMSAPTNDNVNPNANAVASPQLPGARKRITSENLMQHFKESASYKKLIDFIGDLSMATLEHDCLPVCYWTHENASSAATTKNENDDAAAASPVAAKIEVPRCDVAVKRSAAAASTTTDSEDSSSNLSSSSSSSSFATSITPIFIDLFTELHTWISEIPLETLMKSRFGNLAYRSFQSRLRENGAKWIKKIVDASPNKDSVSEELMASVAEELLPYLFDSFGNAVRIDFGTGHEVHFLLILYVLHVNGLLVSSSSEEKKTEGLRECVLVILDEYGRLMSRIQTHYRLEPAGSHGVWGLDDFHHLPFIFGAAQFSPANSWEKECLTMPSSQSSSALIQSKPLPSEIPSKKSCEEIAPQNFFFRAVLNIHKVKSGPFAEHSGVLHSVSGLASWPRVLTGMIKMFEGEVLGKFLIVQHLLFGKTFKWEE